MAQRKQTQASSVALGGVLAAAAVVIMCMGGLIPVATFVCPMLCMLLQAVVLNQCGPRMAWAWYGAVAVLSLLMGPDKEAAAVFVFLGYYPIVKPRLDGKKLKWLWKLLLFNCAIGILYTLLLHVFGLEQVAEDYAELGTAMTVVMLLLGNVTFFLLDRLLNIRFRRQGGK